jgi:cytoskeletal protein CcmA (bactofilin family)
MDPTDAAQPPAPSPAEPPAGLRLGGGVVLEGKLTFAGTVRIDAADFRGTIETADALVVGDGAHVGADIRCGSVVVHGEVTGSIHARRSVELRPSARVRCDVVTPSIVVEKGAFYQGALKMT